MIIVVIGMECRMLILVIVIIVYSSSMFPISTQIGEGVKAHIADNTTHL